MDFFGWFDILNDFVGFFHVPAATAEQEVAFILRVMYILLGAAGGIFLVGLILGGIGLRTMAKKQGLKPSILAFLPFANLWYAGKIAGETNFFGRKMKRAGLYAMLAEIVYTAMQSVILVLDILFTKPEYYVLSSYAGENYWDWSGAKASADFTWQYNLFVYGQVVALIFSFLAIFFAAVVFLALFRKYYAKSPVVMMLLCALLPCRGFVLFAVRNNTPVDYYDYLRRRAEEYARRNAPYNQGGYGGYNQGAQGGNNPPEPFPDFDGGTPPKSDDDPFQDF